MVSPREHFEKREAALSLASDHGCAVFPLHHVANGKCSCGRSCGSPGKHPRVEYAPNGFKNATRDESYIRAAWGDFPDANIAIATGDASDGLYIVDLDGVEGLRAFASWTPDESGIDGQEDTVSLRTGGGGAHLYYRAPGLPSRNRIDGLPVDSRGNGGYVVTAPGMNDKGPYRWIVPPGDGAIAPLPDWLAEKLGARPADVGGIEIPHTLRTHPGEREGARNATLAQLIGLHLAAEGETADLLPLAKDFARRCSPPMADDEVKRTLASITKRHRAGEKIGPAKLTPATRLVLTPYSEVAPQSVKWFWKDRLPLGKLSMLSGDPGLGKTTVLVDLASRASTGRDFPDGSPCPHGTVLYYTLEDGLADTMIPRLMAAGGNREHVHDLGPVERSGGTDIFMLDRDLPVLQQALSQLGNVVLIVIDPISGALGDSCNENRNADLRRVLGPLAKLAEESGACIIGNSHFAKGGDRKGLHRTLGSIAYVAAARTAWAVVEDPDDDQRRLFLPQKNNLGNSPGLAFRLEATAVGECEVARVLWEDGPVRDRLDDLGRDSDSTKLDEAKDWLTTTITDPVPAEIVLKSAAKAGIKERTLKSAKKALGIVSKRHGGVGETGDWCWFPPPAIDFGDQPESFTC